ncbi:MAG: TIGR00266 family protein, partial [Kamptonema sp. SIO4C4]|nr:TIGR00266 family protein [Kamptonema sp. SIO4C4]
MQETAYRVEHAPAYASLILDLQPNQSLLVEASAMAAMDTSLTMKTQMRGGLMK